MEADVVVDAVELVVDGRMDGDFAGVAEHVEGAAVGVEDVVDVVAEVAAAEELVVRLACSAVDSVWAVVELAAVALGECMDLAIPIFQAVLCTEN